jgi:hypothetical protein
VVQEQRESGLTVRDWCAGKGIKESSFYFYLREVRKAALQNNGEKPPVAEQALVERI